MLVKLEKEHTPVDLVETLVSQAKRASKTKKSAEDDDDFDELEESPKKSGSAKKPRDEEDDDDVEEKPDEWEKPEEGDDDWDPDFEEFDLPKSKKAKSGKAGGEENPKIEEDDEFKDLFNENDGGFDDDDEDY